MYINLAHVLRLLRMMRNLWIYGEIDPRKRCRKWCRSSAISSYSDFLLFWSFFLQLEIFLCSSRDTFEMRFFVLKKFRCNKYRTLFIFLIRSIFFWYILCVCVCCRIWRLGFFNCEEQSIARWNLRVGFFLKRVVCSLTLKMLYWRVKFVAIFNMGSFLNLWAFFLEFKK